MLYSTLVTITIWSFYILEEYFFAFNVFYLSKMLFHYRSLEIYKGSETGSQKFCDLMLTYDGDSHLYYDILVNCYVCFIVGVIF